MEILYCNPSTVAIYGLGLFAGLSVGLAGFCVWLMFENAKLLKEEIHVCHVSQPKPADFRRLSKILRRRD